MINDVLLIILSVFAVTIVIAVSSFLMYAVLTVVLDLLLVTKIWTYSMYKNTKNYLSRRLARKGEDYSSIIEAVKKH